MKIRTISYQKVFPLASYVNEKVGVEMELGDTDDENVAFKICKDMVNKWGTHITVDWAQHTQVPSLEIVQTVQSSIDPYKKDQTEIAIDNATTQHELDLLMGDAAKYSLVGQFNAKKKLLNELQPNKNKV